MEFKNDNVAMDVAETIMRHVDRMPYADAAAFHMALSRVLWYPTVKDGLGWVPYTTQALESRLYATRAPDTGIYRDVTPLLLACRRYGYDIEHLKPIRDTVRPRVTVSAMVRILDDARNFDGVNCSAAAAAYMLAHTISEKGVRHELAHEQTTMRVAMDNLRFHLLRQTGIPEDRDTLARLQQLASPLERMLLVYNFDNEAGDFFPEEDY